MTTWLDSGCAIITSTPVARLIEVVGALGDGLVDAGIAALVLVVGAITGHARTRRAGLAAVLAVLVAGVLSVALKALFQMPRPNAASVTLAFPSGHASTAFALAGALGFATPAWAPLAFLVAVLAGVARVYHRAHFLHDVAAGAVLGAITGILLARALLGPARTVSRPRRQAAWALAILSAVPWLVFFAAYERALGAHRLADRPPESPVSAVLRFGTAEARPALLAGWSGDEQWTSDVPMTWVEGVEARLALPRLPAVDHRLQLWLHPYVPVGRPSCQTVEVAVNGTPVGRIWLDTGWRWYEVAIPARAVADTTNQVRFRFAYAARPSSDGVLTDTRRLSVAFAVLRAVPASAGQ